MTTNPSFFKLLSKIEESPGVNGYGEDTEKKLERASEQIVLFTELVYFAQLVANLSKPGLLKPGFTVRILKKLLVGRLGQGDESLLLKDCVRTEDQVAELRYLVEKCLDYKIITTAEGKQLETKLLNRMAVEHVFLDPRYIEVLNDLRGVRTNVKQLRRDIPQSLELLRNRLDSLQGAIKK